MGHGCAPVDEWQRNDDQSTFPQPAKCRMIAARGYFPSKMVLIMVLSVKPVN
jgi:hypothetical protein